MPVLNATWRSIDHCAAPSVRATGVVTTSVARCPGGRAVELHLGQPCTALDATTVIWRFFAAHPR